MTDLRHARKNARDWRAHLTAEERRELKPIESEMEKLRKRLRILAQQHHPIQNRATARARKASRNEQRRTPSRD